jgi:hypothetical protein
VNAFRAELNEAEKKKTKAYEWAVNQARLWKHGGGMINVARVAREASELFNEDVKADTIRLYLCNGRTTLSKVGQKEKFSDDELKVLESAILSYISLAQANCHEEKSDKDIIAIIQDVICKAGEKRTIKDATASWKRRKARIAHHLILDAESIIEMRWQFWTTYPNISLWYDGWESFVLEKGMNLLFCFVFVFVF